MTELRPANVTRTDDGGIHVRELTKVGDNWAVDIDANYRYIGYIAETRQPSKTKKRRYTTEWWATTLVDTRMGPFKSRPAAIKALMEWSGLYPLDSRLTIPALF
jgi:hypothetical protein